MKAAQLSEETRLTPMEAEAVELNDQRKKKAKARQKASISSRAKPFQAAAERGGGSSPAFRQQWARTAAGLSEEEQRKAVLQAIQVFQLLPPNSTYAQHRLKVLQQALAILDKDMAARTSEESDELRTLLQQLKI